MELIIVGGVTALVLWLASRSLRASGPTAPVGGPSIPSGPTAPVGGPSIPSGPTAPVGGPSIPSGPTAPVGGPSIPSGPTGPVSPDNVTPPAELGSPQNPTSYPVQGQFYQVKTGDNPTRIVTEAGLPPRAWRVLRDHVENVWCRTTDGLEMRLYRRWAPPFWRSTWMPVSGPPNGFPVVYIPRESEL